MSEANRHVIRHMCQTLESFIRYAETYKALFADEIIESFKASVRQLRQILETSNEQ